MFVVLIVSGVTWTLLACFSLVHLLQIMSEYAECTNMTLDLHKRCPGLWVVSGVAWMAPALRPALVLRGHPSATSSACWHACPQPPPPPNRYEADVFAVACSSGLRRRLFDSCNRLCVYVWFYCAVRGRAIERRLLAFALMRCLGSITWGSSLFFSCWLNSPRGFSGARLCCVTSDLKMWVVSQERTPGSRPRVPHSSGTFFYVPFSRSQPVWGAGLRPQVLLKALLSSAGHLWVYGSDPSLKNWGCDVQWHVGALSWGADSGWGLLWSRSCTFMFQDIWYEVESMLILHLRKCPWSHDHHALLAY